jgi:hypothetical protein
MNSQQLPNKNKNYHIRHPVSPPVLVINLTPFGNNKELDSHVSTCESCKTFSDKNQRMKCIHRAKENNSEFLIGWLLQIPIFKPCKSHFSSPSKIPCSISLFFIHASDVGV